MDCSAQEAQERREVQRLGGDPVDEEIELDPTVPGQQSASEPATEAEREDARRRAVHRLLIAAEKAMQAGRIDQPPGDSAWRYYREVLEVDPGNARALEGLSVVQQTLIDCAMSVARDFDFDSADRLLEDAAQVTQNPDRIEEAQAEIGKLRREHADALEVEAVRAMDAGQFDRAERMLIELIALGDAHNTVNQLRRRLEEARIYGGFRPGQTIRDHFINQGVWTPESVILLAGSFMMGSSAFEDGRRDNEGPRHRVSFRRGFAIGRTEVTVAQFRTFVDLSGYRTDAEKLGHSMVYDHSSGRLMRREGVNWEDDYEGRPAGDDYPVVHVSWNDAYAYVSWLARGTGKRYRLPSEAEFEYALRAGRTTVYWWGDSSPPRRIENLTGEDDVSRSGRRWDSFFEDYSDTFWGPGPVASFGASPFGLHDMGGNVGEWVMDCWHDTYLRAPTDGTAWVNPGCERRVVRGGYWASSPAQARSAYRLSADPGRSDARIGFRIARDL
jgi:formylglycine-generating enzyme required for sulfatase activity